MGVYQYGWQLEHCLDRHHLMIYPIAMRIVATNNTCNTKYAKQCLRCWQPLLFYVNMAVFEEPAYRAAVRLLPGLDPFCLGHLGSLIQL